MRIIEMTATFGSLEGQTLYLQPGMNWICAPNEWGKSTWCAFLIAMLYGVDTRERSGKESLAVKERYAPWSGKPMEGAVRLEHNGRDITIRRWSRGRVPFGEFQAYETESGLPVRELTAHNCGEMLLGVERSVFSRSGFIRFHEMPVTQDEALRRRLNALVTTGDESAAADRLAGRLKELKNKCRYHKTGLIPQCQAQLQELNSQLEQRETLERQLEERLAEENRLERELERLRLHRQWLEYGRSREAQLRCEQARETLGRTARELRQVTDRCQGHLSRQELELLLARKGTAVQKSNLPLWLSAIGLAVGLPAAGMFAWQRCWMELAVSGLFALGMLIWQLSGQAQRRRRQELGELFAARRQEYASALEDWDELERLQAQARQAREDLQLLEGMVQPVREPEEADPLELTPEQTRQRGSQVREALDRCRLARGECLGRMESLPQADTLGRQIGQTRQRLEELELYDTALGYAQKALEEATERLHRRFAPRLTRRAQELLARLTGGRYDQLLLSQELALTAAAKDEVVRRSSLWRSDGTGDQMYLALRLAVWEELIPQAPLVLDDALVRFDAERLEAARELLEELALEHQVIVFTCR